MALGAAEDDGSDRSDGGCGIDGGGDDGRPPTREAGRSTATTRAIAMGTAGVLVVALAVVLTTGHHNTSSSASGAPNHAGSAPASTSGSARSTSPSSSGTAATTTRAPSRSTNPITFTAVGDLGLGRPGQLPADPASVLADVQAALAAPIVFANLEGTLTSASGSKCGAGSSNCVAFEVPASDATVLRQAGFTVVNSANNHSHDFGTQGADDTKAALAAAGIAQTGLPGQIAVVADGATKVAFVGFGPYRDINDMLDVTTARFLIAQARREAAVVVVYMHAGAEGASATHVTGQEETYVGEDRGNAEAFAHAAIDDGADVVVASGPHVLRGIEDYHGHLIDYSLGNFANYHDFISSGTTSLSGILRVTVGADGRFGSATFTSVRLSATGHATLDPTGASAQLVNSLSASDFGSAGAHIGPDGRITLPGT